MIGILDYSGIQIIEICLILVWPPIKMDVCQNSHHFEKHLNIVHYKVRFLDVSGIQIISVVHTDKTKSNCQYYYISPAELQLRVFFIIYSQRFKATI